MITAAAVTERDVRQWLAVYGRAIGAPEQPLPRTSEALASVFVQNLAHFIRVPLDPMLGGLIAMAVLATDDEWVGVRAVLGIAFARHPARPLFEAVELKRATPGWIAFVRAEKEAVDAETRVARNGRLLT